jgi:hypothetical protein
MRNRLAIPVAGAIAVAATSLLAVVNASPQTKSAGKLSAGWSFNVHGLSGTAWSKTGIVRGSYGGPGHRPCGTTLGKLDPRKSSSATGALARSARI